MAEALYAVFHTEDAEHDLESLSDQLADFDSPASPDYLLEELMNVG